MTKEKKNLIIGNWKMYNIVPAGTVLIERLKKEFRGLKKTEAVFCPSFVDLYPASREVAGTDFKIGAQNVFWEDEGAYTGEVSPLMLKGIADYVIVGHSERRIIFSERDVDVSRKVAAAVHNGLTPIICVGDTWRENENGLAKVVATSQVEAALYLLTATDVSNVVIAYEPIWAIGSGKVCKPADAAKIIVAIRKTIEDLYGKRAAEKVRVLYGGSVDGKSAKVFLARPEIDGVLVGGASVDFNEFSQIIKISENLK